MTAFRRLDPAHRFRLLALIACALLVRAIVPGGWMPIADAHGLRIVLCSGSAPVAKPAHHAMAVTEHDRGPDHHSPGVDHPCAFAGLVAALDLPAPVAPLPVALPRRAAPLVQRLAAVGHGLAAPPPPQTGPPLN